MEELLGIRLATPTDSPVRSEVLMNNCNLPALLVKICYDLTAGAEGLPGFSRARVSLAHQFSA